MSPKVDQVIQYYRKFPFPIKSTIIPTNCAGQKNCRNCPKYYIGENKTPVKKKEKKDTNTHKLHR